MLLELDEIEALCAQTPGLEGWILPERAEGPDLPADLLHFGGSAA